MIENPAGLSNLELPKVELLLEKSKSVFDDIFPGLHGDNFGRNALDLEDLEEQIDVKDLIKMTDQIEFFTPEFHRLCVQENAFEKGGTSRINDKITQGILSFQTTNIIINFELITQKNTYIETYTYYNFQEMVNAQSEI